MQPPRVPKHVPPAGLRLWWHEGCGHFSWGEAIARAGEPLEPTPSDSRKNPIARKGGLLCPGCGAAQQDPFGSEARLVGSAWLKRIAAIGFGRARKEGLKELRFHWHQHEGLWIYPIQDHSLEYHLNRLALALECKNVELVDTRCVPPVPMMPSLEPNPAKKWEVVTCSPGHLPFEGFHPFTDPFQHLGTIPWPPSVEAVVTAFGSGEGHDRDRLLVLPTLAELSNLGFSRSELFHLIDQGSEHKVAICTRDLILDGRALAGVCRALPQGPLASIEGPPPIRSKGGRPPSAQQYRSEVLRLTGMGWTAARIARTLPISSRSVRRMVSSSVEGMAESNLSERST